MKRAYSSKFNKKKWFLMILMLLCFFLCGASLAFAEEEQFHSVEIKYEENNPAADESEPAATPAAGVIGSEELADAETIELTEATEDTEVVDPAEATEGETENPAGALDDENAASAEASVALEDKEEPKIESGGVLQTSNLDEEKADVAKAVTPGIKRIYGASAYDTAVEVAKAFKEELGVDKFDSVIVTRGDHYADALSGNYFAAKNKAPILLVKEPVGKDDNKGVFNLIKDSLSKTGIIYILGGPNAVSDGLENSLKSLGQVDRIWGQTLYDTNLEILKRSNPEGEDLLIATGKTYPDALCASALGKPILLVADELRQEQRDFLNTYLLQNNNVYILGGNLAVSDEIEKEIALIKKPERVSGETRFDTSIEIAEKWFDGSVEVGLATADRFEDAMVGGVYAYEKNMPIILSSKTPYFHKGYKYIFDNKEIKSVTIFGGPLALSDDVAAMNEKGARKTGLLTVSGNKYFTDDNGNLVKNTSKTIDGKTYHFGSDGIGRTDGIILENGKYYLYQKGKKATGECRSYVQDGVTWNVIKGVATKVVTEKDKVLNRALKIISQITSPTMTMAQKLRKCWDHLSYSNYPEYNPRIPHYKGMDWPIIYANDIFVKGGGNCISLGAAFAFLAKGIGYTDVYACHSGGHGWTMIDGLVYDREWSRWHNASTYYGIKSAPDVNYKAAISAGYAWMKIRI